MNRYPVSDRLVNACEKVWSQRVSFYPVKGKITNYHFKLNSAGHWYDSDHESFLNVVLGKVGVTPIPDYVDYCLITTDLAKIKFRKNYNFINLYLELL